MQETTYSEKLTNEMVTLNLMGMTHREIASLYNRAKSSVGERVRRYWKNRGEFNINSKAFINWERRGWRYAELNDDCFEN